MVINTLAIETGIEPEYEKNLIESAKKLGWRVLNVRHVPFTEDFEDLSDEDRYDSGVWFHGDINGVKAAQANTGWQVHANWKNLNLLHLTSHAEAVMYNKYHFRTMQKFYEDPWSWFSKFGSDHLFIKSATADKTISGMVINARKFEEQWALATFYEPPWDTLVAISEADSRPLTEVRLLVVDQKIVTGSYYRVAGKGMNLRLTENQLHEFYNLNHYLTSQNWRGANDPSYVLDLVQPQGEDCWYIMEVGATSCCGLYDCDTTAFLQALGERTNG